MGLDKGFDRNGLVTGLISSCHGWLLNGGGNLDPGTFVADCFSLLWYRLRDFGLLFMPINKVSCCAHNLLQ